jgi:hypothetical protein
MRNGFENAASWAIKIAVGRREPAPYRTMSDIAISVTPAAAGTLTFDVVVRDARGESRHRVTIEADEAERWGKLGAEPCACVKTAMRFLVDREPKESILSAFDMRVIRRYFLEFDDALPVYLARSGGKPGSGA